MSNKQHDILTILWEAGPNGEVRWYKDGRRSKTITRCPYPASLKELVRQDLAEAETRTCSTWQNNAINTGDFYTINAGGLRGTFDSGAYRAALDEYDRTHVWQSRVEIWARLTPKGIAYCTEVLGL